MNARENLFEGPAVPMPLGMPRGSAGYVAAPRGNRLRFRRMGRPAGGSDRPVRHVEGYAPFIEFCESRGIEPAPLTGDLAAATTVIRAHRDAFGADEALDAATTIFLGNVLVALRPDAIWRNYEGGSPTVGGRHRVVGKMEFEVDGILRRILDNDQEWVAKYLAIVSEWVSKQVAEAQEEAETEARAQVEAEPQGRALTSSNGPSYYRRPAIEGLDGDVIPFIPRWGGDGPPPEAYGQTQDAGRFAALHPLADALIDHLVDTYDVDVDAGPELASDLTQPQSNVVGAVRATPRHPDAVPLTFVFTAFPGVIVHAAARDHAFPRCGCDACDEYLPAVAADLEDLVLEVAEGRSSEADARSPWPRPGRQ